MKNFTLLMFSMSSFWEWQSGIRNRNFFILRELLKQPEISRVIMVNYLPWNLKRAIKEGINLKFKMQNLKLQFKIENSANNNNLALHAESAGGQAIEQFNNSSVTIYKDLTNRLYQINKKLFIYSTIDPFFSKQKFIKKLKNILISQYPNIPISQLILWSYYPLFIDYYAQIPAYLKIFDAVDDWRAHPSYIKQKDLLDKNYQKIKQQANIIFTVSRYLKESLFRDQENVFVVQNGANIPVQSSTLQACRAKCQVPSSNFKFQFGGKQQPVIGYVGNIQNRIDFQLIKFLVQRNPDKLFVLAGKVWPDVDCLYYKVKKLKNIRFIGHIPHQDLSEIINQFAVAIVPHKINDLTKSMDPMKIYEYLSCGLPVVSTTIIDPSNFDGLVNLAKTREEFNQKINQNLTKKQNAGFRQQVLNFAQKNTWEKRVEKMLKVIGLNKN